MLRRALVFALTLTTSGVWSSLTFRVRQCPTHAETAVEQKRRNRGRYAATRRATSSLNHALVCSKRRTLGSPAHTGSMQPTSNAAPRDAAPAECNRTSGTRH